MIDIYAGETTTMTKLPSPVAVTPSRELIWSANTGRGQESSDKAKMVGDVVGEKITYAIKWGIISTSDLNKIVNNMKPPFFYFGIGTSANDAKNSAKMFYRSEITYDIIVTRQNNADVMMCKDVQVSVIEQ